MQRVVKRLLRLSAHVEGGTSVCVYLGQRAAGPLLCCSLAAGGAVGTLVGGVT